MNDYGRPGVNKFARTTGLDTGQIPADMWDIPKLYSWLDESTFLYIASSNNADTQYVIIQGLDFEGLECTVAQKLTGQTPVKVEECKFFRVSRAFVLNGANTQGDVYISTEGNPINWTSGVPNDLDTVQAKIFQGFQQTRMAIYTVPKNKKLWLTSLYFNLLPKNVQHVSTSITVFSRDVTLRGGGNVGNWRGQGDAGLITTGTSYIQRKFSVDEAIGLTPLTDIRFTCTLLTSNDADVSCGFAGTYEDV